MTQISPLSMEATTTQAPVKPGNPGVVGLAGFGMTTMMLQFHNLGLIGVGPVIWLGFIFGGLAQMLAGFQEQKMGNNFGYSAFTAFGCFWLSLCACLVAKNYNLFPISGTDLGWFLVGWTAYTAILWVGSTKISKAMFFTFTTLLIGFLLLDAEHFGAGEAAGTLAAYDLILCALGAWYMMASTIFKDLWGRDVLPVGRALA